MSPCPITVRPRGYTLKKKKGIKGRSIWLWKIMLEARFTPPAAPCWRDCYQLSRVQWQQPAPSLMLCDFTWSCQGQLGKVSFLQCSRKSLRAEAPGLRLNWIQPSRFVVQCLHFKILCQYFENLDSSSKKWLISGFLYIHKIRRRNIGPRWSKSTGVSVGCPVRTVCFSHPASNPLHSSVCFLQEGLELWALF